MENNNKKEYYTAYNKAHYAANKEKRNAQDKAWMENNRERKRALNKAYREANKLKSKEWREANKEKLNNWFKARKQADPLFKLKQNIKSSIARSFLKNKLPKNTRTTQILGCSFEELKHHIESQFEPWMNWGNRGGKVVTQPDTTWDVDHIIPLDSAETEEDIIRLNHYTNLRPLCSYQNRFVKRNKVG